MNNLKERLHLKQVQVPLFAFFEFLSSEACRLKFESNKFIQAYLEDWILNVIKVGIQVELNDKDSLWKLKLIKASLNFETLSQF